MRRQKAALSRPWPYSPLQPHSPPEAYGTCSARAGWEMVARSALAARRSCSPPSLPEPPGSATCLCGCTRGAVAPAANPRS